ncbi:photosynthetic NDH subunit of lumenal location 3, chloroplastic [Vitis vinifera]|uniref:Photosynthetic NDH subunit of lumenal location 3, chloroplastic n=2 Tax=Vitis vinifera TaxID=29760 RepID=A5AP35_VITVI|eukprot:XP_002282744.1 PREDICTED: photosynthetic NDH subunit of lumenal location 3, chloroplastic [Vitis vinifera]
MAHLANLHGASETLPSIFKLRGDLRRTRKRVTIIGFLCKKAEQIQEQSFQATRRSALGLSSIAILGNSGIGPALAEDNGYWLTGPLPVPTVDNDIVNKETGTRSFLKKGLYIADVGTKGRMLRLKKYAFDLIALEDLMDKDAWNYFTKYLRLKSTFMYYDFDKLISAVPVDEKQPLTDLANRLFDCVEKLEDAVKIRDISQTESRYKDTKTVLQEVMDRMA